MPYRRGDYFYFTRTEQGQQYPIYCARKGCLTPRGSDCSDLNELAKGRVFHASAHSRRATTAVCWRIRRTPLATASIRFRSRISTGIRCQT